MDNLNLLCCVGEKECGGFLTSSHIVLSTSWVALKKKIVFLIFNQNDINLCTMLA